MKLVKVTEHYTEYYDEIWGTVKLVNWNSFLLQTKIADKINGVDVNEKDLEEGYDELCKEYIGAP